MASSTLGIDLASQPANTAGCLVRWEAETATVERLELNLTDEGIRELAAGVDKVGIDAPFGWPEPFVAFVQAHAAGSAGDQPWHGAWRDSLRFRRTDMVVRETMGKWPLSVSTDLIGITALRCAGLLSQLGVQDRSGNGPIIEVYPALALHRWCLLARGYKGIKNVAMLVKVLADLRERCSWLHLSADHAALLARSDHAFDALISALVARAAMIGRTLPIPERDRNAAAREGWIHIPEAGSLAHLMNG